MGVDGCYGPKQASPRVPAPLRLITNRPAYQLQKTALAAVVLSGTTYMQILFPGDLFCRWQDAVS